MEIRSIYVALRVPLSALCSCCALVFGGAADRAHSQTLWELSPYRIGLLVGIEQTPEMTGACRADLLRALLQRAEAYVGAPWQLQVEPVDHTLQEKISRHIEQLEPADVEPQQLAYDKVWVLGISTLPDGLRIAARDFDCRTRRWGVAVVRRLQQPVRLADAAFQSLVDAFAPIARFEVDAEGVIRLHPRAAALAARDAGIGQAKAGDLFLPLLRRNDRQGNPVPDGIRAVPWTFLVVRKATKGGSLQCELKSGLRRPLSRRVRGRIEQLALGVPARPLPVRLVLRSRADPPQPLVGYDVYVQDGESDRVVELGRSGPTGVVVVPAGPRPLRTVLIKNGDQLLARLPVVGGYQPVVVAQLPDDAVRLDVEGFVQRLRDNLVDTVAQREILIARVDKQMAADQLEAARVTLDRLQTLPTREEFARRIAQHRQRTLAGYPQTQARIDQLYRATEKLLGQFLDADKINRLQSQYNQVLREKQPE